VIVAIVFLLASDCRGSGGVRPMSEMTDSVVRVEVELNVFSGRPDPVWTLSEAERGRLEELLSGLSPGDVRELPEPLGYRGFTLKLTHVDGRVTEVRVYKGAARVKDGEAVTALADPGRTLERWLVTTGSRLEPELRTLVLNELQNG
jgi:hypothetical protein